MFKALKRLCAALCRRERARLAALRAGTPDELLEAVTLFALEARFVRRWRRLLEGRRGLLFRRPLAVPTDLAPSDLVDFKSSSSAAAPAPVGLRLVR